MKTLDAIHLASAFLFQEARAASVLFATHDGSKRPPRVLFPARPAARYNLLNREPSQRPPSYS